MPRASTGLDPLVTNSVASGKDLHRKIVVGTTLTVSTVRTLAQTLRVAEVEKLLP